MSEEIRETLLARISFSLNVIPSLLYKIESNLNY